MSDREQQPQADPASPSGASADAQQSAAPAALPVRVAVPSAIFQRHPAGRTPVAAAAARVAELARVAARNPAVVASATAVMTVAAEVGLRLLQQQVLARAAAPPAGRAPGSALARPGATVRLTETWSATRTVEIRYHD
ncbi:MAG: hypothetical protein M3P96_08510 [Actinomycetota bacterium]|nr:hypothetical protein [Actinomycetota bacterium]